MGEGRSRRQAQGRAEIELTMKLMTVAEVAELLRLGESTVYALLDQGKIAGFRIGPRSGGIRISEDDVWRYLESCRVGPKEQTPKAPSRRLKHIKL